MINRSQDQVNTILALSKSPPSAAQIRRLAYAFDWPKSRRKPCKVLGCHGTQQMAPRNGEVEVEKTDDLNHQWIQVAKDERSLQFLSPDGLTLSCYNFRGFVENPVGKMPWNAECLGKIESSIKKSDKLDCLVHHPDISSCIFSTFHWSRMALDTQKASTPQLCIWLQHGWRLFSEPRSNRNICIFGIFICSYIYTYIYIYIHVFFWILLMTVGIVRCSTFYRLDAKDGCLTWEWNFRWMPVIVLTPHVQTSMKGKWVQKLRCMPCCATGVWRYVLM